jgi:hypothetical protein
VKDVIHGPLISCTGIKKCEFDSRLPIPSLQRNKATAALPLQATRQFQIQFGLGTGLLTIQKVLAGANQQSMISEFKML